jgi:hypothetical protein
MMFVRIFKNAKKDEKQKEAKTEGQGLMPG